jgi:hypothetical protein
LPPSRQKETFFLTERKEREARTISLTMTRMSRKCSHLNKTWMQEVEVMKFRQLPRSLQEERQAHKQEKLA